MTVLKACFLQIMISYGLTQHIPVSSDYCVVTFGNVYNEKALLKDCRTGCGRYTPTESKPCVMGTSETNGVYKFLEGICKEQACVPTKTPTVYNTNEDHKVPPKPVTQKEWENGCNPKTIELPERIGLVPLGCTQKCGEDLLVLNNGQPCGGAKRTETGAYEIRFGVCYNTKCITKTTVEGSLVEA